MKIGRHFWGGLISAALVVTVALPVISRYARKGSPATVEVRINGVTFTAELATTPDQHERGLMFREELPDRHGMLFVFHGPDTRTFWMRNTYVPLDIIFIGEDKRILNVESMPALTDQTCQSRGPAMYVLEVPARSATKYGLGPGMVAGFELPKSLQPAGSDGSR